MSNSRDFIFGWSFPLFRVFGIAVRVHWIFVAWVAYEVLQAGESWQSALIQYGILFGSVLLHEFGHSLACRSVGGKADRILLWPLGGLAECNPPLNPWASLWTTLCGPAVNLLLMAGAAAVVVGQQRTAGLESPIVSLDPWHMVDWSADMASPVVLWAAIVYLYNYVLFLFNMAFVCYPMDAGRVLQEVLWLFIGYARSLWVAVHIGLVMAVVLMVMGATQTMHMGTMNIYMGVFFLMRGWAMRQSIAALRDHYGSWAAIPDPRQTAQVGGWLGRLFVKDGSSAAAPVDAPMPDQAEIDRILRKVSEFGLASLTEEEMATLKGSSN